MGKIIKKEYKINVIMCGFSGIFTTKDTGNIDLKEMFLLWVINLSIEDQMIRFELMKNKLALAHQRLSILDLSKAGHQPMMSKCGRYVLFLTEKYIIIN